MSADSALALARFAARKRASAGPWDTPTPRVCVAQTHIGCIRGRYWRLCRLWLVLSLRPQPLCASSGAAARDTHWRTKRSDACACAGRRTRRQTVACENSLSFRVRVVFRLHCASSTTQQDTHTLNGASYLFSHLAPLGAGSIRHPIEGELVADKFWAQNVAKPTRYCRLFHAFYSL